jgi:signal transduction histidine kinase
LGEGRSALNHTEVKRRTSNVERSDLDRTVISVQDTGQGIPPEVLPRVFERFYTTKEGALGLGLPLVRKVMAFHGGEVRLRPRPGGGTEAMLLFDSDPMPSVDGNASPGRNGPEAP